ncbi:hypothetical protein BIY23_04735 [Wolbachia pipientis]|uniref:Uncharacterized protein n=1 Tax=Wolbachia pipientis TaxID=955 RepID=A0A1E7QKI7_WOLPI|nr:hypothetical protein [Wolbachia pipientis]OEY86856.1 hypothetical protein BIY23_04735 [Wolbachia pipientis]
MNNSTDVNIACDVRQTPLSGILGMVKCADTKTDKNICSQITQLLLARGAEITDHILTRYLLSEEHVDMRILGKDVIRSFIKHLSKKMNDNEKDMCKIEKAIKAYFKWKKLFFIRSFK